MVFHGIRLEMAVANERQLRLFFAAGRLLLAAAGFCFRRLGCDQLFGAQTTVNILLPLAVRSGFVAVEQ